MNNQFDELTKSLAQSVTRRTALKKFGVGLAGMALACFGLANKAIAATHQGFCHVAPNSLEKNTGWWFAGQCLDTNGCVYGASLDCPKYGKRAGTGSSKKVQFSGCGGGFVAYRSDKPCSFTV